ISTTSLVRKNIIHYQICLFLTELYPEDLIFQLLLKLMLMTDAYVRNNPLKYTDPSGEAIFLKTHVVMEPAAPNHASVVIVPNNQEAYRGDHRFIEGYNGMVYATLGAGPVGRLFFGNNIGLVLESDNNRERDADLNHVTQLYELGIGERAEADVINDLFLADSLYRDHLQYDPFPLGNDSMVPLKNFNSNSYVRGLLAAVGILVPEVAENLPGFNQPVPVEEFRPRSTTPK
ncbi:MAG: hypothetical protein SX243_25035, partial [Acidobacteriota bacterium]|nr:hypothetical protein [Acidobacteriota bacterium]